MPAGTMDRALAYKTLVDNGVLQERGDKAKFFTLKDGWSKLPNQAVKMTVVRAVKLFSGDAGKVVEGAQTFKANLENAEIAKAVSGSMQLMEDAAKLLEEHNVIQEGKFFNEEGWKKLGSQETKLEVTKAISTLSGVKQATAAAFKANLGQENDLAKRVMRGMQAVSGEPLEPLKGVAQIDDDLGKEVERKTIKPAVAAKPASKPAAKPGAAPKIAPKPAAKPPVAAKPAPKIASKPAAASKPVVSTNEEKANAVTIINQSGVFTLSSTYNKRVFSNQKWKDLDKPKQDELINAIRTFTDDEKVDEKYFEENILTQKGKPKTKEGEKFTEAFDFRLARAVIITSGVMPKRPEYGQNRSFKTEVWDDIAKQEKGKEKQSEILRSLKVILGRNEPLAEFRQFFEANLLDNKDTAGRPKTLIGQALCAQIQKKIFDKTPFKLSMEDATAILKKSEVFTTSVDHGQNYILAGDKWGSVTSEEKMLLVDAIKVVLGDEFNPAEGQDDHDYVRDNLLDEGGKPKEEAAQLIHKLQEAVYPDYVAPLPEKPKPTMREEKALDLIKGTVLWLPEDGGKPAHFSKESWEALNQDLESQAALLEAINVLTDSTYDKEGFGALLTSDDNPVGQELADEISKKIKAQAGENFIDLDGNPISAEAEKFELDDNADDYEEDKIPVGDIVSESITTLDNQDQAVDVLKQTSILKEKHEGYWYFSKEVWNKLDKSVQEQVCAAANTLGDTSHQVEAFKEYLRSDDDVLAKDDKAVTFATTISQNAQMFENVDGDNVLYDMETMPTPGAGEERSEDSLADIIRKVVVPKSVEDGLPSVIYYVSKDEWSKLSPNQQQQIMSAAHYNNMDEFVKKVVVTKDDPRLNNSGDAAVLAGYNLNLVSNGLADGLDEGQEVEAAPASLDEGVGNTIRKVFTMNDGAPVFSKEGWGSLDVEDQYKVIAALAKRNSGQFDRTLFFNPGVFQKKVFASENLQVDIGKALSDMVGGISAEASVDEAQVEDTVGKYKGTFLEFRNPEAGNKKEFLQILHGKTYADMSVDMSFENAKFMQIHGEAIDVDQVDYITKDMKTYKGEDNTVGLYLIDWDKSISRIHMSDVVTYICNNTYGDYLPDVLMRGLIQNDVVSEAEAIEIHDFYVEIQNIKMAIMLMTPEEAGPTIKELERAKGEFTKRLDTASSKLKAKGEDFLKTEEGKELKKALNIMMLVQDSGTLTARERLQILAENYMEKNKKTGELLKFEPPLTVEQLIERILGPDEIADKKIEMLETAHTKEDVEAFFISMGEHPMLIKGIIETKLDLMVASKKMTKERRDRIVKNLEIGDFNVNYSGRQGAVKHTHIAQVGERFASKEANKGKQLSVRLVVDDKKKNLENVMTAAQLDETRFLQPKTKADGTIDEGKKYNTPPNASYEPINPWPAVVEAPAVPARAARDPAPQQPMATSLTQLANQFGNQTYQDMAGEGAPNISFEDAEFYHINGEAIDNATLKTYATKIREDGKQPVKGEARIYMFDWDNTICRIHMANVIEATYFMNRDALNRPPIQTLCDTLDPVTLSGKTYTGKDISLLFQRIEQLKNSIRLMTPQQAEGALKQLAELKSELTNIFDQIKSKGLEPEQQKALNLSMMKSDCGRLTADERLEILAKNYVQLVQYRDEYGGITSVPMTFNPPLTVEQLVGRILGPDEIANDFIDVLVAAKDTKDAFVEFASHGEQPKMIEAAIVKKLMMKLGITEEECEPYLDKLRISDTTVNYAGRYEGGSGDNPAMAQKHVHLSLDAKALAQEQGYTTVRYRCMADDKDHNLLNTMYQSGLPDDNHIEALPGKQYNSLDDLVRLDSLPRHQESAAPADPNEAEPADLDDDGYRSEKVERASDKYKNLVALLRAQISHNAPQLNIETSIYELLIEARNDLKAKEYQKEYTVLNDLVTNYYDDGTISQYDWKLLEKNEKHDVLGILDQGVPHKVAEASEAKTKTRRPWGTGWDIGLSFATLGLYALHQWIRRPERFSKKQVESAPPPVNRDLKPGAAPTVENGAFKEVNPDQEFIRVMPAAHGLSEKAATAIAEKAKSQRSVGTAASALASAQAAVGAEDSGMNAEMLLIHTKKEGRSPKIRKLNQQLLRERRVDYITSDVDETLFKKHWGENNTLAANDMLYKYAQKDAYYNEQGVEPEGLIKDFCDFAEKHFKDTISEMEVGVQIAKFKPEERAAFTKEVHGLLKGAEEAKNEQMIHVYKSIIIAYDLDLPGETPEEAQSFESLEKRMNMMCELGADLHSLNTLGVDPNSGEFSVTSVDDKEYLGFYVGGPKDEQKDLVDEFSIAKDQKIPYAFGSMGQAPKANLAIVYTMCLKRGKTAEEAKEIIGNIICNKDTIHYKEPKGNKSTHFNACKEHAKARLEEQGMFDPSRPMRTVVCDDSQRNYKGLGKNDGLIVLEGSSLQLPPGGYTDAHIQGFLDALPKPGIASEHVAGMQDAVFETPLGMNAPTNDQDATSDGPGAPSK